MHKWIMAILLGVAGVMAAYLLLFEMPAKEDTGENHDSGFTVPDTAVDAAAAESIYKSNCMGCHGDEYQGGMGPALNQIGATSSKEKIFKKIAGGGGGMPAFEDKLSEEDIINLTNWMSEFK